MKEYNEKRDFTKSPEPQSHPNAASKNSKLRFVVQFHKARRNHYDLRLEWEGVLLSWAVPKMPSYNPKDKRLAVLVEDHPLKYRTFEGEIPKGQYGGGTVEIWDSGFWKLRSKISDDIKSQKSIKFQLFGKKLHGLWTLVNTSMQKSNNKNWLLIKEKDAFAQTNQLTTNPFSKAEPQLAKLEMQIPPGDWLCELKYDGYRIISFIEQDRARLVTRNGLNCVDKYKEISEALITWAASRAMVLDGELVVIDKEGKTDFQSLQSYPKSMNGKKLVYVIFDLLALDGEDLKTEPLIKRKEKLEKLMRQCPNALQYSQHLKGSGKQMIDKVCENGFEGIVAKKSQSVYSGTRNGDWIKIKCINRQEFIIGGYSLREDNTLASLLLGVYEEGDLKCVGRVGTGFTEQIGRELIQKFKEIKVENCPFKSNPKMRGETVQWVKPIFCSEVQFADWTEDLRLRHPSFKGLREDKEAHEVIAERSRTDNQDEVVLTKPERIVFKDLNITKKDIADYYKKVFVRMLPHIKGRLLSLVRCPDGVHSDCFYKKHPCSKTKQNKGITTVGDYYYINDLTGILGEVQMNTIEFHVWGSHAVTLEKPDLMVFDLDPDVGVTLAQIRQGAKDLKSILDKLGLTSFLKTSGGKGYHIVVPFEPWENWETFRGFAKNIAELTAAKWPDRYTTNIRKDARHEKIFIDWIRNTRSATSIAPYSIRAKEGATVSMPIKWSELNKVAPNGIDIKQALIRIKRSDPWKGFRVRDDLA